MREKRNWFQRPLAALCILASGVILSVCAILNSEGRREGGREIAYRISLRHYGSDIREMETSAAIPLEDKLSAIPGISRIMTTVENGRLRVLATFRQRGGRLGAGENDCYEAVREAAQRVYETLPSSAQRPELSSGDDSRIPFWTAAVFSAGNDAEAMPTGFLLERTIKPALDRIEGIGEVEVAGPGIKEIVIVLDPEKTAALGLSPADVSRCLGGNDALFPAGLLRAGGLELPIQADGRYLNLEDLGEALIPLDSGAAVKLKEFAETRELEREAETLSRLNGKRAAIISVTAASGADRGRLSRRLKKEVESFSSLPLEFRVLEDRGAEESAAFRSVLAAALEASVLTALAALFLGRGTSSGLRGGIVCAAAIPVISTISAALLSMAGFPVNGKFLAGLAAGIGGSADAVILSAEGFGRAGNAGEGGAALRDIWPPLVSGAATTAAALIPLIGISADDVVVIAGALGTVTLVSAALALTLLPPLFLWEKPAKPGKSRQALDLFDNPVGYRTTLLFAVFRRPAAQPLPLKRIRRGFSRSFAAMIRFCVNRPLVFPLLALLLAVAAVGALALAGADTAGEWTEDSVYARVEFEGGFLKEEGDALLAFWALEIKKHPAVRDAQTGARTGSGYALVTFDSDKAANAEIREYIRSRPIPGAFVYIPEPSPGDRVWNIAISGDDADKCRELAAHAASLCSASGYAKETVLNFKEGGPRLSLIPRREIIAGGGTPFSFAADTVRRGVHGPVAYKRAGAGPGGGETDVRIRFGSSGISGGDVSRIPLASRGSGPGGIDVASLTEAVKSREASSVQRENRRRIASFSIRTAPGDPRVFRDKTMELLKKLELPPGYAVEFDPEAIRQAEALTGKIFSFIWAVLFCYMIVAAAEESFALPLIVLSSILPSLAFPVLILCVSGNGISAAVACALVAVSGMTVNASAISAGELWRAAPQSPGDFYRALRSRMPALISTTGTTIAGALPFLFLREGNNALIRTIALATVLGVGASFFFSVALAPSLVNLYFRIRFRGNPGNRIPHCRDSKATQGVL